MKKILFLLLIITRLSAGVIEDLEQAIMKSNLPAVEQLLDENISISDDEKNGLINLATEIIRKRENKIALNEFEVTAGKDYNIKYLNDNKEITAYFIKGFGSLLLSGITFVAGCSIGAAGEQASSALAAKIGNSTAYTFIALSAAIFIGSQAYFAKGFVLRNKIIAKFKALYNDRYNTAIKIRNRLYKIKTKTEVF